MQEIDSGDFTQLLQSLEKSDVLIRLRVSGEPWIEFSKLVLVSDNAMILQNSVGRKIIINITNVVAFELFETFHSYDAGSIYEVNL